MATSLLQVRIEDSLKDQAAAVFENLGIDTSTAVRIFLKRAVMENGIPFKMTLPRSPYVAERGYRAMVEMSENAKENGVSDMTLDEINAAIKRKKTVIATGGSAVYGKNAMKHFQETATIIYLQLPRSFQKVTV